VKNKVTIREKRWAEKKLNTSLAYACKFASYECTVLVNDEPPLNELQRLELANLAEKYKAMSKNRRLFGEIKRK